MPQIELTFIVVHYHEVDLLLKCLNSIYTNPPSCNFEVIVVDNDDHRLLNNKMFVGYKNFKLIKNTNTGYGQGNNIGAKYSKGSYLFILNPDTELLRNTADILFNYIKNHSDVAVVAPVLIDVDNKKYDQIGYGRLTPMRAIFSLSFIYKLFPQNSIAAKYFLHSNLKKIAVVDVVPGSAFLINKTAFKLVGGFDPIFFLYFEENDLFRRIRDNGFKVVLNGEAKIKHLWGGTTNKGKSTNKHFNQSRYKYFRKHYGLIWATIVELFARTDKKIFTTLSIFSLSMILRYYSFDSNLTFHGELGHNYLAVKNFLESGAIPFVGPPTSHAWLSFGPLFYWFISPIMYFGGFDPYWPAFAMALLHIFSIPIALVFVNKLFGWKSSVITALLLAISPVFIQYSRDARFFSIVLIIFWPFLYSLIKKYYFLTFFLFSVMLNFHLSPLVLLPGIVTYLFSLKERSILKQNLISSGIGFFVPQIPYLIHLLVNSPITIIKIIAWIPYRVAGFIGIIPKNNISSEVINANSQSVIEFFSSIFSSEINFVIAGLVVLIIVYYFLNVKGTVHRLIKVLFTTSLAAVFIHGDPPSHYYLPILPLLVLIISNSVKTLSPRLVALALFMLFVFNINYYFGEDPRFKQGLIPYNRQVEVVTNILKDANGASIHLKRVGPYDYFEEDYAQNYQYLAWLYGNKPVKAEQAQVIYTIYEKEGVVTYQRDE